jgi:hypothetical protein
VHDAAKKDIGITKIRGGNAPDFLFEKREKGFSFIKRCDRMAGELGGYASE